MEQQQKEQQKTTMPPMIEWQAPEFVKYEKNSNWLGLWLIISITAVTLAIIFKNFLFAVFLIFAALSVFLQGLKDPKIVTFKITPRGVEIGKKLLSYDDIESFWILYEPPHTKELLLQTKKMSMGQVSIPIEKENPVHIRQALINYIPEKEEKQSIVDIIAKFLHF